MSGETGDLIPVDRGTYQGDLGVEPEVSPSAEADPEPAADTAAEESQEGSDSSTDKEPIKDFDDESGTEPPPAEGEGAEEPPTQQLTWGEKTYNSFEEATGDFDQRLKSIEGRLRVTNQENKTLQSEVKQWNDWYQYQQNTAQTGGEKPSEAAEQPKSKDAFFKSIDWQGLGKLAESDGYMSALQVVALKFQDELEARDGTYNERLKEASAPVEQMETERQYVAYAQDLWKEQVGHVDTDGNYDYPELIQGEPTYDHHAAQQITKYWGEMAQKHPEYAMTPDGVRTAVNAWREYAARTGYERAQPGHEASAEGKPAESMSQAAKVKAGKVARDASGRLLKQQKAQNDASADISGAAPDMTNIDKPGPAQSMSEASQRKRIKNAGRVRNEFLAVEE
jgi:hypothetical protein